jgi:hypothetical protein
VFIKINGKTHYLWRAVDQDGNVLDILVQSRRNAKAAARFFRKLLKGLEYVPRVLVTDELASYGVAQRRLMPGVEHRRSEITLCPQCLPCGRDSRPEVTSSLGFRSPHTTTDTSILTDHQVPIALAPVHKIVKNLPC